MSTTDTFKTYLAAIDAKIAEWQQRRFSARLDEQIQRKIGGAGEELDRAVETQAQAATALALLESERTRLVDEAKPKDIPAPA